MNNLIKKSICLFVLMFFIGISIISETFSVYISAFDPINGNVNLVTPGVQNYPEVFYKVAETNDTINVENGVDPTDMTGDADAFMPIKGDFNLSDGYTFCISVTTSELDKFEGMGFYFCSYANPKNSTVTGVSLMLTTDDGLAGQPQFAVIEKNYNSLGVDDDLSDGNDSIIFVEEDFWKYDNAKKFVTGMKTITNKLASDDKYDGKTLDFRIAVKQDTKDKSKINIQATINDFCNGNFTLSVPMVENTDDKSVLCVGAKTFHTGDTHFSFTNIKITNHETYVPWKYQTTGEW